jgi:DNA-binding transcriptional ArsR family regulator/uncharacterized protein YndB with AHSA1/START domain
MDEVFKALNDTSRRSLLDHLFEEDGQTLGELCGHLPDMTRFGVMNHLRVLEDAGLVATRKVGRTKLHYLNPVPIRLVHDRWISKYTERLAGAIAGLKTTLEGGSTMSKPVHVYQAFIDAPAEKVWNAIVDGDVTVQYFYGTRVESEWEPGSKIVYTYPDGSLAADGEILSIRQGAMVEMTFHARWDPELEAEGPVREIWLVEEEGTLTKLSVEMHDIAPDSRTVTDFSGGLVYIVSGMKTLLETGSPIAAPV